MRGAPAPHGACGHSGARHLPLVLMVSMKLSSKCLGYTTAGALEQAFLPSQHTVDGWVVWVTAYPSNAHPSSLCTHPVHDITA